LQKSKNIFFENNTASVSRARVAERMDVARTIQGSGWHKILNRITLWFRP
jgi:hypothetical protein